MYAVVKLAGRQYMVEEGETFEVNRLKDLDEEDEFSIDEVLMLSDEEETLVGLPFVEGASVEVNVLEHFRGEKVIVFKKKRKERYSRKYGHRQDLTKIEIESINFPQEEETSDEQSEENEEVETPTT